MSPHLNVASPKWNHQKGCLTTWPSFHRRDFYRNHTGSVNLWAFSYYKAAASFPVFTILEVQGPSHLFSFRKYFKILIPPKRLTPVPNDCSSKSLESLSHYVPWSREGQWFCFWRILKSSFVFNCVRKREKQSFSVSGWFYFVPLHICTRHTFSVSGRVFLLWGAAKN